MDWSKVKQRAESRFSRSLRGRLSLHLTRYRKSSRDHLYELWFSFDGKKRCGVSDGQFYEAIYDRGTGHYRNQDDGEQTTPSGLASKRLVQQSLDLGIEELLSHASPVVRALGIIDARFGERRLRLLDISSEHPFVAELALLRAQIDGIKLLGSALPQNVPLTT